MRSLPLLSLLLLIRALHSAAYDVTESVLADFALCPWDQVKTSDGLWWDSESYDTMDDIAPLTRITFITPNCFVVNAAGLPAPNVSMTSCSPYTSIHLYIRRLYDNENTTLQVDFKKQTVRVCKEKRWIGYSKSMQSPAYHQNKHCTPYVRERGDPVRFYITCDPEFNNQEVVVMVEEAEKGDMDRYPAFGPFVATVGWTMSAIFCSTVLLYMSMVYRREYKPVRPQLQRLKPQNPPEGGDTVDGAGKSPASQYDGDKTVRTEQPKSVVPSRVN